MELRTLHYFVAVVDAGSVSAAATVVHVTQPAISRQLRQLETELGVDLFIRRSGRLNLSAAGRQFVPHARAVIQVADDASVAAKSYAAGRLESIAIAAPTTTLTDVIAPFLSTLDVADPMPTVIESDSKTAFDSLRQGTDLAIVTEKPPKSLDSLTIAVLPVWAYVRDDNRFHGRDEVTLKELVDETLLVLAKSFKPRQILDTAVERHGDTYKELIECSNPQVAQALAAAGRGVAVVSDDPRFGLHPLEIVDRDRPLRIRLFAAWDREHHAAPTLSELARRLEAFVRARYGLTESRS
jgi:DNA-binding transcriptional LysR family regulator